jgi:hypothetical protein
VFLDDERAVRFDGDRQSSVGEGEALAVGRRRRDERDDGGRQR